MRRAIEWDGDAIVIVDQTLLPGEFTKLRITSVDGLIEAIQRLAVRGAPALGVAGALGVALVAGRPDAREQAERLARARPTAVNLRWGVEQALSHLDDGPDKVLAEAQRLAAADEEINKRASFRAAEYVKAHTTRRPLRLHTHCNTGWLATAGWGTALGIVWHLANENAIEEVLVDETRPLLQGARLTAFELAEANIPYRILPDSAAATALAEGKSDAVVVGADRIAANGDVANKIGTYPLALAAKYHGVPFLVVAPESTIDANTLTGKDIAIEERDAAELGDNVPYGSKAFNPAFDVTPALLITAIVTEDRVWEPG